MATHVAPTSSERADRRLRAAGPTAASVRVAAMAGAVFFALILVHAQLRSGAPSATDSGSEIYTYVTRHQDRLQLDALALGLAMPAALVWLSGLFGALRRAEGGTPTVALVAFGGGVLAAAGAVTCALVEGTTAVRVADLDPAGARVWWTLFLLGTGAMLLGLLTLVGATAVVSLRSHLFGRRFAMTTVLLALISAVGALTVAYGSDAIQTIAGLAVLFDSVWIFIVSVLLWRHPARGLP